MNYINSDDLKKYLPSQELANITEVITESETNIDAVISDVSSFVNSKLQKKYDIPVSEELYDISPIKNAVAHIVIWNLSNFYSSLSETTRALRRDNYNDALLFIHALESGTSQLVMINPEATQESKYHFDSVVRIKRDFR